MKTELRANEKVILTLRKHVFTLVPPIFWTSVLLLISLIGYKSEYALLFLIGGGVTLLWLVYKVLDRKSNIWVVTNIRVIDESGVFAINSKESPLDKINNVSYRQPLIGRIFNFGHVQIQTAAEMGSSVHSMVEKPKQLKDAITRSQEEYRQAIIEEQAKNPSSAVGNNNQPIQKTDIAEELTKLHGLMMKGIITEDEFNQLKAKILAS